MTIGLYCLFIIHVENIQDPRKQGDLTSLEFTFHLYDYRASVYNRMKLMFVGVQGIGKTSLLCQLRKEGRSTMRRPLNVSH